MGAAVVVGIWALATIASLAVRLLRRSEPAPRSRSALPDQHWDEFARQHGFRYERGPDPDLGASFRYLRRIGQASETGVGWAAWDIVNGTWRDRPVLLLTVSYRADDASSARHLAVTAVQAADRQLPDLTIRPEGTRTRLANLLTNRDIDLDSIEFSRAFELASPDRRFATEFCSPAVIEFLLEHRSIEVETYGQWLLTATGGPSDPADVEERLDLLSDLIDVIPTHVLDR